MSNYDYDIADLCYKLYKIDWMESHVYADEKEVCKDWYENGRGLSLSEYIQERGLKGNACDSYEKFMKSKFGDSAYIEGLLQRESLIEQYREYIEERER